MKVVNDQRADSTLDAVQPVEPGNLLAQIAQEELEENEALAQAALDKEDAEADAMLRALVEDWQAACRHGGDIVTSAVPALKDVWAPERMDGLGAALARADAHYGWGGAGRFLGHPLVAVGVAALPIAIGTATWARAEKAARHAQRIAQQRGEVPAVAMAPGAPKAMSEKHPNAAARVTNFGAMMDSALARDSLA